MTEKFHFTHNNKSYTLPYLTNLKVGVRTEFMSAVGETQKDEEDISAAANLNKAVFSIARIEGRSTENAVKDMTSDQFGDLVKGWLESTPGVPGK